MPIAEALNRIMLAELLKEKRKFGERRATLAAVARVLGMPRQNWGPYVSGTSSPNITKVQGWIAKWNATGRLQLELTLTGTGYRITTTLHESSPVDE